MDTSEYAGICGLNFDIFYLGGSYLYGAYMNCKYASEDRDAPESTSWWARVSGVIVL